MEFYPVKVKDIDKSVEGSTIVSLDIPEQNRDLFKYTQGQFLAVQTNINQEQVRRSYSLCSSPLDNEWKIGIKKIPQGIFSSFAHEELKVGDQLEIAEPDGRFFVPVDSSKPRTLVAFAAGSGITPILSIIKTHLALEPQTEIKLFYTNKSVQSIMLKEELEALKNQYMDRFEICYFLTQEHRQIEFFNGRVDKNKLNDIFKLVGEPKNFDHYFLCGPEEMILTIKDYLINHEVQDDQIHYELFFSGEANPERLESIAKEHVGKKTSLTINEGGKTFEMEVDQGKGNILDYALQRGADLPYACKGGVCCTCRAMLNEGEVEMPKSFGLEPDEIEEGYILTCQAIPLTDKVVVDFDV